MAEDKTPVAAARALGMKVSEIVEVADAEGGVVVTTHDGQKVYAAHGDEPRPWAGEPPLVVAEPAKSKARR